MGHRLSASIPYLKREEQGTKLQLESFGNTRLREEGFATAVQQIEKFAAKEKVCFWLRIQKILSSNIEFFLGWSFLDLFLASFPQSPLKKKVLALRRWLATEYKIRGAEACCLIE